MGLIALEMKQHSGQELGKSLRARILFNERKELQIHTCCYDIAFGSCLFHCEEPLWKLNLTSLEFLDSFGQTSQLSAQFHHSSYGTLPLSFMVCPYHHENSCGSLQFQAFQNFKNQSSSHHILKR